jgi:hypothetical protein
VNVTTPAKRDLSERQTSGTLMLTLANGILHDQVGRIGYIAANFQFQFDNPVQAGAIFTAGFSVCSNGSLALGGSAVFYQCLSGNFFNLYDRHWAAQCNAILIELIGAAPAPAPTPAPQIVTSAIVSVKSEGQPVPTNVVTTIASEKGDGQPVITSISERPDGQPVMTVVPAPVSQIGDGQIQASTAPAVSEKPEGQPVVTSQAPAVSEKPEGQPVVTSQAPAVSEKPEGQPVVTSQAPAVSEKSEGQPVVTSQAVNVVSTASSTSSGPPAAFTGAAAREVSGQKVMAMAAGIVGAVALL